MTPEAQARVQIDRLLQAADWHVCNIDQVNLHAAQGVAIREFPLNTGHGFAYYQMWQAQIKAGHNLEKSLAAMLNNQSFGFSNQNLTMDYGRTQTVVNGVSNSFDAYLARLELIAYLTFEVVKKSPLQLPLPIRDCSLAQCHVVGTTVVERRCLPRKLKTLPSLKNRIYGTR
jgi:hypothetical protein